MDSSRTSFLYVCNGCSPKRFVVCLLSAAIIAISVAFFLSSEPTHGHHSELTSRSPRVWPKLEANWRSALVTIIGFLDWSFGTVSGLGGGGLFVPMLNLIVGFDIKSAAALSKCMIMGASASSVWYNLGVLHPSKEFPIIDYDLALLFQPMFMLGISIGVSLSVVFPCWLISFLIFILVSGTSLRVLFKGIEMWNKETIVKIERAVNREMEEKVIQDSVYEPLLALPPERSGIEILLLNLRWKGILVLVLVWFSFLLLQVLKNGTEDCSAIFWLLNILQFPVALSVFGWEAVRLWRESRARRQRRDWERVCEASIEWSAFQLFFCALFGLLGGTVVGLVGSGGGFVLEPLLLDIGVVPQVASATSTFVMLFSSSLSVVEFYFLKRFPIPYALYLIFVSVTAGFWGQFLVRKMVKFLKRASIILFILSAVIYATALTMGLVLPNYHEYMGFLGFCHN